MDDMTRAGDLFVDVSETASQNTTNIFRHFRCIYICHTVQFQTIAANWGLVD